MLARETANGFSLYTEKVVISAHNSMPVSSVIDAEQELDVSHGFAAEHLELLLELQVGYLAGRDPCKISLDQAPRLGWNICVACCYVQSLRRMNQF